MNIFISYRRAEDEKSWIVGTIHEKLANIFGHENVFRDTYDIAGGEKWRSVLDNALNECNVMLVIIGPDWANLAYPNGEKRLFDPKDVTRWEVETGLRRSNEEKTTVIPVLVTGAAVPRVDELPESLAQLLDKNVRRLRNYPDFNKDIEDLIQDIRRSQGYAEDDIPTESCEPKTILIADEQPFLMGSAAGQGIPEYETPQHNVRLPAYRIGKYPVKNSEYEEFAQQTGKLIPRIMGWKGQSVPDGREDFPVLGVTWYEAMEYCKWLSQLAKREYTLPNEAQWEKACRGPYGCTDLVGNVLQWTCTLWGEKRNAPDPKYRYPWKNDGRNTSKESPLLRVVRGIAIPDETGTRRCVARRGEDPEDPGFPDARHGFRVLMIV